MGRKRLVPTDSATLLATFSRMLVPERLLEHFDIFGAVETGDCWTIELREKEGFVPTELSDFKDVVFDGYCNPLDALSHSFICKPVRLKVYRRRYKRSGSDQHFSNEYDITLKGVRMVPELGLFLKE